ncbi:hypothetical protein ACOSQ2_013101 [Xanthoceras sorbifolium]
MTDESAATDREMNLRRQIARCGDRSRGESTARDGETTDESAATENRLQQRWCGAAAGDEDWKTIKRETSGDDW